MIKTMAANVVVSKGYEGTPALKFSENGNSVRFRIGERRYDTREEDKHRWFNLSVKAFGDVCERIKKMKLKEGSFINISGRLDEDRWTDKDSGEKKSLMVLILDDIDFAYSGKSGENQNPSGGQNFSGGQNRAQGQGGTQYQQASAAYPAQGIAMQGTGQMQQVAQMQPVMQGMPQMAPAARTAPAQMPQQQMAQQQMAQGQMAGQAQLPAGQVNGQAPATQPQNQAGYNGFTGFEAYGGNNLFAE